MGTMTASSLGHALIHLMATQRTSVCVFTRHPLARRKPEQGLWGFWSIGFVLGIVHARSKIRERQLRSHKSFEAHLDGPQKESPGDASRRPSSAELELGKAR